ncbi:30S ribosomal protein S17 [Patescibacteria group bacterium]|nr:30S ribosomal protein S17 [Patescibacteria group bacterium]MBU2472993.1 30S ribosomal protein S17 [Patescibacteria group bacterium]
MNKENKELKENKEKKGRLFKGVIVSDKMDKTVIVLVNRYKKHPKYKKRYKISKKYKAHDENNKFKTGDKVVIQETRPISKDKKWIVKDLITN